MAPTGVGKSIALTNAGAAAFRRGHKVLHVTLELSKYKTKLRYAGVFSKIAIRERFNLEASVRARLEKERTSYDGDIIIYEYPPDEISVDNIYQLIKWLKRVKGWVPDIVVIDYLELMISRNNEYNKDEYKKQKKVSTEIRGLAKNEDVLIITATQTNRDTTKKDSKFNKDEGAQAIDLNRIAESYGKSMPTDYIVSINQTPEEYNHGRVRFYVAKNRNGPKFKTVAALVDYKTMIMKVDEHMRGKQ
jgi:replicative DNA helicase